MPALVISMLALAGLALMLGVRRRRIYVRVTPGAGGAGGRRHTGVSVAGLPKGTDPGLEALVEDLVRRITEATTTSASTDDRNDRSTHA